jgi:hypothetical protein
MEEQTKTKKKNITGYCQNMDKNQVGKDISFFVDAEFTDSQYLYIQNREEFV